MAPDPAYVFGDAFFLGFDGQPVDVFAFGTTWAFAAVVPTAFVDGGCFQAFGQQIRHDFIAEQFHAAVGVMDDKPFSGAQ